MEFPFGIQKEAEIYCNSAIIAMKQQPSVQHTINAISQEMQSMGLEDIPYEEIVPLICQWTEENVAKSGWQRNDEDGVSWLLGLTVTAYVRSLRNRVCPFEKLFKDCFIYYFK